MGGRPTLGVRGRLGRSTALGTHGRTDAPDTSTTAAALTPGDIDAQRLGTDLLLPEDPDATIPVTPTGDLPTLSGRPNLRAAVRRRLVTTPGTLVHRPAYGAGALRFLETANTPAGRAALGNAARRALLQDVRLRDVAVSVKTGLPSDGAKEGAVTVSLTMTIRDDPRREEASFPVTE